MFDEYQTHWDPELKKWYYSPCIQLPMLWEWGKSDVLDVSVLSVVMSRPVAMKGRPPRRVGSR